MYDINDANERNNIKMLIGGGIVASVVAIILLFVVILYHSDTNETGTVSIKDDVTVSGLQQGEYDLSVAIHDKETGLKINNIENIEHFTVNKIEPND